MAAQIHTANPQPGRKPRVIRAYLALVLLLALGAQGAAAQQTRLVVRDTLGLTNLLNLCKVVGCTVDHGLGDPSGQLFLVKTPQSLNAITSLLLVNINLGIITIELDQLARSQGADAGPPPSYLTDKTPMNYYGATVWRGYILSRATSSF